MASSSVYIRDMWEALSERRLPGSFAPDGCEYRFPRVGTRDSRGNLRHWEVRVKVLQNNKSVPFNSRELLAQPVPELAPQGYVGVITTESWHEGGERHQGKVPTMVKQGRNRGKKNATNVATQALRDALGLYNKHLKSAGQTAGPEAAGPQGRGKATAASLRAAASSRPHPMLVKKIDAAVATRVSPGGAKALEIVQDGLTVQRKLNGVRVVARPAAAGAVELYSRTGGVYPGMDHVKGDVAALLEGGAEAWRRLCEEKGQDPWNRILDLLSRGGEGHGLPRHPAVYLDGELYRHGKSLNWISGQSRGQKGGDELEYWVFDCFFPALHAAQLPVRSATRQRFLDLLFEVRATGQGKGGGGPVKRVENFPVALPPGETLSPEEQVRAAREQIDDLARRFVEEGYEGAIVRKDGAPYEYGTKGYHSSHLMKVKPLHDAEFPVVGYTQGESGKDVGALIWICEVPAERSKTGEPERFNVVPKNMSYADRYRAFRRLGEEVPAAGGRTATRFERDFKGLPLTVEYPELSAKTGKPTQAKALVFRVYEPAPGRPGRPDPLAELLND